MTLSSCEAELVAIQAAVQEAIGLLRSLSFVLRRIQVYPQSSSEEDSLDVVCPILLWTDSLSGKMLLEGTDLHRRSRHIDIKVNWLRELLAKEILKIGHVRGTGNIADNFTKCLPTIKALEYMDVLGFSAFEGMLLDCLFDFEIRDNSFSSILSAFSTRNCMFCGEPCEELPYSNQETVVLPPFESSFRREINALVAVCESFQGEGIGSAMAGRVPAEREEPRAPDSHALLGHPPAEGVSVAPESDEAVSIIGGEAKASSVVVTTAEAVMSAAAGDVAVPKAAEAVTVPEVVADETATRPGVEAAPVKAPPARPKKKAMPARGRPAERSGPSTRTQAPGREPAVKRMPKRPRVVIQVKKEAYESAGLLRRRREAARRRVARASWRARQREALAYFAAQRREEEAAPNPTYEVDRGARLPGQRRVYKRMYNPQLNKREELEINPKSLEEKQPFLKSFSGFSRRDPRHLKCGHCGQKGHIISQCPGMERRVSLTRGGVMLTPRGGHEPESVVNDEVSPGDSISQVGLTSESLRLHNKRLRGHGWTADEQPKSPPRTRQRTEMKPPATPPKREGRPQAAGSTAAVVTGPPKGWQQPPPLPPPTTRPPLDTPKTPPKAPANTSPPKTPPPPQVPPPQVPPPPQATPKHPAAPKTPPKTPQKAKAAEPSSPKASPGAKPISVVSADWVTPKEEPPQRPFRVGAGGQLEAVSVAPSTGYSMSMIPRSGGANAMADTAAAVDATHETSEVAASSGRPRERRLQTCIACHGSGELPMSRSGTASNGQRFSCNFKFFRR